MCRTALVRGSWDWETRLQDQGLAGQRMRQTQFALCIENSGNEASLILGKVYRILPDARATRASLIRIIDESGEDYLFNECQFVRVEFPAAVTRKILAIQSLGNKRFFQQNPPSISSHSTGPVTAFLPHRERAASQTLGIPHYSSASLCRDRTDATLQRQDWDGFKDLIDRAYPKRKDTLQLPLFTDERFSHDFMCRPF